MVIHKPYTWKIEEKRIGGTVKDYKEGQWFSFEIDPKERNLKKGLKELIPRIEKVENEDYNYFRDPPFKEIIIRAVYLNEESKNGLYKDSKNNLPYEIWSIGRDLLYRQSIVERKKDIFNKLEKAAIEEGLRK